MSSSDESVSMRQHGSYTMCEGWLEHKGHTPQGVVTYVRLWLVLKGDVIFLFKNEKTVVDNQVGNLTIDHHTSFAVRGGDSKKGYKFDLSTGRRLNRFKSRKLSERELWRGYILGIAQGKLPKDLDLLDHEVEKIQSDIDSYKAGIAPSKNRISTFSADSGVETIDGQSRLSFSASVSTGSSNEGRSLDNGGPTMVHKFYYDRSREQTPPGWFIAQCSRQLGEKILEVGFEHGNTLMRASTTHQSNGSYVISKRVYIPSENRWGFEHYEVMRTVRGYKLNVENPHEPMRSLSEVMEYFVRTSGGSSRPLTTNNLDRLGLNMPNYDTLIPSSPSGQPWVWPPEDYDDKHSSPKPADMAPHRTVTVGILRKDNPKQFHNKQVGFTPSDVHARHGHTVSGNSTRTRHDVPSKDEFIYRHNANEQLQNLDNVISDFETDRVYYNDTDFFTNARATTPKRHSRVAIPSTPSPPAPCGPASSSYVNELKVSEDMHSSTSTLDRLPVAPPPPRDPVPIQNVTPQAYETKHRLSDGQSRNVPHAKTEITLDVPITSSHEVKPSIKTNPQPPAFYSVVRKPDSPVKYRQRINEPVQAPLAASTTPAHVRPVASVQPTSPEAKSPRHTGVIKPPMSKSVSVGQLPASTWSPASFPQWKGTRTPETGTAQHTPQSPPPVSPSGQSGVDDAAQGGVNTLRSKFENINTGSQMPVVQRKGRIRGAIPTAYRHSVSVPIIRMDDVHSTDDIYESIIEHEDIHPYLNADNRTVGISNVNSPIELTNTTNTCADGGRERISTVNSPIELTNTTNTTNTCADGGRESMFSLGGVTDSGDIYDDTAVSDATIQSEEAVRHNVASSKQIVQTSYVKSSNTDTAYRPRRKTEPDLRVTRENAGGISEDFKTRLEGLFAGSNTAGSPIRTSLIMQPSSHPDVADEHDHLYEELPPIEPDEVTYLNDLPHDDNR